MHAVTDTDAAARSGVAHGEQLVRFAEAVLGRDDALLERARQDALDALGPEAFVDAAAVVGNFQRMVRIADGCGIPLDAPLQMMSAEVRDELRLERFGTSANTPPAGLLARTLGPLLRNIAPSAAKLISRRMGSRT